MNAFVSSSFVRSVWMTPGCNTSSTIKPKCSIYVTKIASCSEIRIRPHNGFSIRLQFTRCGLKCALHCATTILAGISQPLKFHTMHNKMERMMHTEFNSFERIAILRRLNYLRCSRKWIDTSIIIMMFQIGDFDRIWIMAGSILKNEGYILWYGWHQQWCSCSFSCWKLNLQNCSARWCACMACLRPTVHWFAILKWPAVNNSNETTPNEQP